MPAAGGDLGWRPGRGSAADRMVLERRLANSPRGIRGKRSQRRGGDHKSRGGASW